jgi:hypothetical protein
MWVSAHDGERHTFVVRLSSNSVAVAVIEVDPDGVGSTSADGQWKRIVRPFSNERLERTIGEEEYFNKIDLIVEKPRGTATLMGAIHVKGLQLHVAAAEDVSARVVDGPPGRSARSEG